VVVDIARCLDDEGTNVNPFANELRNKGSITEVIETFIVRNSTESNGEGGELPLDGWFGGDTLGKQENVL